MRVSIYTNEYMRFVSSDSLHCASLVSSMTQQTSSLITRMPMKLASLAKNQSHYTSHHGVFCLPRRVFEKQNWNYTQVDLTCQCNIVSLISTVCTFLHYVVRRRALRQFLWTIFTPTHREFHLLASHYSPLGFPDYATWVIWVPTGTCLPVGSLFGKRIVFTL